MNERIKDLFEQACFETEYDEVQNLKEMSQRFAELIKQAIYDKVMEELMEDDLINSEPDRLSREYLKGCNGGIVDALCHIKNFGVDIDEE